MRHAANDSRVSGTHRNEPTEDANMSGKQGIRPGKDSPVSPPSDTAQTARDAEEKRKHPASENALESSQDKNPIPPGSTRK